MSDRYIDEDEIEEKKEGKTNKVLLFFVILLALLLIGLASFYYIEREKFENQVEVEKDILIHKLDSITDMYDSLERDNVVIKDGLAEEREKVEQMALQIRHHNTKAKQSLATIRKYQEDVAKLRDMLTRQMEVIDSLKQINKILSDENNSIRNAFDKEQNKTALLRETAEEMQNKIDANKVLKAKAITYQLFNKKDREVTKINKTDIIKVNFEIIENSLATPGKKDIYLRIKAPNGSILTNSAKSKIVYQGGEIAISAIRDGIDYQNQDLEVSIFYKLLAPISESGQYQFELYSDGVLIGKDTFVID